MRTLRIILILLAVAVITSFAFDADAGQGKGGKPAACAEGWFPATGQTTTYPADTQTGADVTVPDDGTVQAGTPLSYTDNGDGTITDNNTGLMWEKKDYDSSLHGVQDANRYPWSSYGAVTIWDWLAQINAEEGTGFAGYRDWRIPNIRELLSIVDYGAGGVHDNIVQPVIAAAFNTGCMAGCTVCSCTRPDWHWSSTEGPEMYSYTNAALAVHFQTGVVLYANDNKSDHYSVRAVRGGCINK